MRPRIELHIGELVLHGFAPRDRWTIADAVQSELSALLAMHGVTDARGINVERLDAGTIALPANPAAGGRAIGAAIHSVLGDSDADAHGNGSR